MVLCLAAEGVEARYEEEASRAPTGSRRLCRPTTWLRVLISRSQAASVAVDLGGDGWPWQASQFSFGEIPRLFLGQKSGASMLGDKRRTGLVDLRRPTLPLLLVKVAKLLANSLAACKTLASTAASAASLVLSPGLALRAKTAVLVHQQLCRAVLTCPCAPPATLRHQPAAWHCAATAAARADAQIHTH